MWKLVNNVMAIGFYQRYIYIYSLVPIALPSKESAYMQYRNMYSKCKEVVKETTAGSCVEPHDNLG